ncbi:MAG TPA: hypothetical protein VFO95_15270, partial [Gemmatimonadales bacterium]|nr:hypothetical protein [Gemmatimonadales bacterium]
MVPRLKPAVLALLAFVSVLAWTPIRVEAGGAVHCQETGSAPNSDHAPTGQPDCGSPCDPGACPPGPCASLTPQIVT